ncbi:MAG: DUF1553 domain-containing protein [Pedosphaera sp.]|nr:DUF1553 domain-containing protein [Pedosphaera sp.]
MMTTAWHDGGTEAPARVLDLRLSLQFVTRAIIGIWCCFALAAAADPSTTDEFAARHAWAFHTPKNQPTPRVKASQWPQKSIDAFILARLEEHGLTPAPPAEKRVLIRRATFDLLGLPPTAEDVEAFLADLSPDAFTKVVERLLGSPQYGEQWGRHWLDQVRYADSVDKRQIGQPGDISEAYRYRDWVVNAFNDDLPYDQFVIQQFAGDLIPGSGPDGFNPQGIVATSMLAIGRWEQGEADKEKMMTDIVDDQVDVTGRTFLGLTLACARCHDHKFDPISAHDYYALAGTFYSSHIIPEVGGKGGDTQRLRIPLDSPAELERRKKRELRIGELEDRIERTLDEAIVLQGREILRRAERYLIGSAEYRKIWQSKNRISAAEFARARSGSDSLNPELFDAWTDYLGFVELNLLSRLTTGSPPQTGLQVWQGSGTSETPWAIINEGDQMSSFAGIGIPPRSVSLHPSPNAGIAVSWESPVSGVMRVTGRVVDAHDSCGDGVGWEIKKGAGQSLSVLSAGEIPNGGAMNFEDGQSSARLQSVEVMAKEWIQLSVLPKANHGCDSTRIELEIAEIDGEKRKWNLIHDLARRDSSVPPGNPQRDSFGHPAIWFIHDLSARSGLSSFLSNSILAKWFETVEREGISPAVEKTAREVQASLIRADDERSKRRQAGMAELGERLATATDDQLAALTKKLTDQQVPLTDPAELDRVYRDLLNPRAPFWARHRRGEVHLLPEWQSRLDSLRKELADLKRDPPPPPAFAHGIRDGGVPKSDYAGIQDTRLQIRGRYDRLGEVVPRRLPQWFGSANQPLLTNGSGRLQLARWIASPENPLTARVMVNRIWQFHFGEGIVRTASNYGKLGQPPSHPELLDHLARHFIESGWSIKAMHREILLSATYQQSSEASESAFRQDPDNVWFGRMNRRRLTAEAMRDSLLAANGSLDLTRGGPPVRDINLPRRTLYLMTVRSDGSSYRTLFDAADPTAIVEQRTSTTVAPQALFLLNNSFALAQASKLAELVQHGEPRDDAGRIEWLYRRLFGRPPAEREVAAGLGALAKSRRNESDPGGTKSPPAAWERYCQVLLCANEFLYID